MRRSHIYIVLISLFFTLSLPASASANLIPNGNLETVGANGLPASWFKGGWGINTRALSYPVSGHTGQAIKVDVSAYTSGDAKWYFNEVPITGGKTYNFSDYYQANVPSVVTVQFKLSDGRLSWTDIASPAPANSWTKISTSFTAPANATAATVFHLIKTVGSLVSDDYELTEADVIPPDDDNLFTNGSLERGGTTPDNWSRGRWGTNTTQFTYPISGTHGSRAARVEITSYSSGDAKWYPAEVPVTAGKPYEFLNQYRGSGGSFVTVQYRQQDGSLRYFDIGQLPPSSNWSSYSKTFTPPAGTVSVTVFHLIKEVGWLEIDNYVLKPSGGSSEDGVRFPQGMVSLTFDDGWRNAYQNAIPILNSAGYKSDQFIITERLSQSFPGYVKSDEVLAMQSAGHVIGAHTVTHRDLTSMPLSEAEAEIRNSRDQLRALGASPVNFFAYPFGAYNAQIKTLVQDLGFIGGRSSDDGINFKNGDLYALKRRSVEFNTTVAQVKDWIDTARRERGWVILLFHRVDSSGTRYSITPERFQEIVNYLKNQNVKVVTLPEAVELWKQ